MRLKLVAALVALPLLAACAPEVESTIFLKDAMAAAADGELHAVPAVLRVPQSSEESCNKGLATLIANLKALAPVSGEGKCIEKKGDQLAEIETEMDVVSTDQPYAGSNIFVLDVRSIPTGANAAPSYGLSFRLAKPLDEIVKALAANSDELQAEFDPAKFIFTLNNDIDATAFSVEPLQVFVDGKPGMPGSEPLKLAYRDTAEIVLSDVASEYVAAANRYEFAIVTATQPD